jgi:methyl-accepting chemotaxis protein
MDAIDALDRVETHMEALAAIGACMGTAYGWECQTVLDSGAGGLATEGFERKTLVRDDERGAVALPVLLRLEVAGVIEAEGVETGALDDAWIETLQALAKLAGGALTRLDNAARQQELLSNALAVTQVLEAVNNASHAREAAEFALEEIRGSFGFDEGVFWKVDGEREAVYGFSGLESAPTARIHEGKGGVTVPVRFAGSTMGALELRSRSGRSLSPTRQAALQDLATITAAGIHRLEELARERESQEALRQRVSTVLDAMQLARAGILNQEIDVQGDDDIAQVADALRVFLAELRQDLSALTGTAKSLTQSYSDLSSISQSLAANAEETSIQASTVSSNGDTVAKNVEIVAGTSEELMASIREIARNAHDSARVVSQAVDAAESASETIARLGVSSQQIGQVSKLITSIAQQTNLLALNATIEAARAGEYGKGFAVVATEVKELAKQTAKATEEISQRIGSIQSETQNAVQAIGSIGGIIHQVESIAASIAAAVEQQSAATNEIGRSVNEAASGVGEIARNIAGVAEAARNTTQSAAATETAANQLRGLASHIRELCAKFDL